MEFRLTYAGKLLAHRDDKTLRERSIHVHDIRREFHKQLRALWQQHPALAARWKYWAESGHLEQQVFKHDGFDWLPMVTKNNFLMCGLDILLLRPGSPGDVLHDLDNKLKTIFDALKKADGPKQLGAGTQKGQQTPNQDEIPFFVLLEDDRLITHVAVTADTLLQPVLDTPPDTAVRLVISVNVRPYFTERFNMEFA